jgi:CheY-like chemotaxis protein
MPDPLHILLVEPETLLRRTVTLTARSIGIGHVHEAASNDAALKMLRERTFHGAVIAVECVARDGERHYDLSLVDRMRDALTSSHHAMPIAIMADQATPTLLRALQDRRISRVILKPFRAKVLLETIAGFGARG